MSDREQLLKKIEDLGSKFYEFSDLIDKQIKKVQASEKEDAPPDGK